MALKKVRVTNFKSFKDLEPVELGKFNVLIGANASGKSNFIQIFKFLQDITNSGLDNAISMQGGIEYLRNINIGPSEKLSINVVSDREFGLFGRKTKEGIKVYETNYEFVIMFKKRGTGFEIVKDNLTWKCNFFRLGKKKGNIIEKEKLGEGEIVISHIKGRMKIDLKSTEVQINVDDIPYLSYLGEVKLPPNTLMLEGRDLEGRDLEGRFSLPVQEIFSDISIFDFDTKLAKKATPITGKAELEEDGSNLSIVLKNIIENKDQKRKLINLISDLLPFVSDLGVEKFADKSLLFKLQEKYFKKQYIPSSLISEGTINIIALIIALYFEKNPLTIIEEPERNIHPYLIYKMVNIMKDASEQKQIIVTTHNPETVKNADSKDILLVSRDKEGFSTISKPADKDGIKTFIKNEIGIEELYVQSLLEV